MTQSYISSVVDVLVSDVVGDDQHGNQPCCSSVVCDGMEVLGKRTSSNRDTLIQVKVLQQGNMAVCGYHAITNMQCALRALGADGSTACAEWRKLCHRGHFWHEHHSMTSFLKRHAIAKGNSHWPWTVDSVDEGTLERSYLRHMMSYNREFAKLKRGGVEFDEIQFGYSKILNETHQVIRLQKKIQRFVDGESQYCAFILGVTNHWVSVVAHKDPRTQVITMLYLDSENLDVLNRDERGFRDRLSELEQDRMTYRGRGPYDQHMKLRGLQAMRDQQQVLLLLWRCVRGEEDLRTAALRLNVAALLRSYEAHVPVSACDVTPAATLLLCPQTEMVRMHERRRKRTADNCWCVSGGCLEDSQGNNSNTTPTPINGDDHVRSTTTTATTTTTTRRGRSRGTIKQPHQQQAPTSSTTGSAADSHPSHPTAPVRRRRRSSSRSATRSTSSTFDAGGSNAAASAAAAAATPVPTPATTVAREVASSAASAGVFLPSQLQRVLEQQRQLEVEAAALLAARGGRVVAVGSVDGGGGAMVGGRVGGGAAPSMSTTASTRARTTATATKPVSVFPPTPLARRTVVTRSGGRGGCGEEKEGRESPLRKGRKRLQRQLSEDAKKQRQFSLRVILFGANDKGDETAVVAASLAENEEKEVAGAEDEEESKSEEGYAAVRRRGLWGVGEEKGEREEEGMRLARERVDLFCPLQESDLSLALDSALLGRYFLSSVSKRAALWPRTSAFQVLISVWMEERFRPQTIQSSLLRELQEYGGVMLDPHTRKRLSNWVWHLVSWMQQRCDWDCVVLRRGYGGGDSGGDDAASTHEVSKGLRVVMALGELLAQLVYLLDGVIPDHVDVFRRVW